MAAKSRAGVGRNSALEARVAVWCGRFSHAPEHPAFAEGTYWAFPAAGVMRPAYSSRTCNADLAQQVPSATRERNCMPRMAVEPDDEAAAIERMIGEGAPDVLPLAVRGRQKSHACAECGAPKAGPAARCSTCGIRNRLDVRAEPSAAERAAERRAARRVFRTYCVACGRSNEGSTAPARPGRCPACGGTMLVELAAD
jgi:DNA-directed RNA polymerase subunit RPC12/RpoP